MVKQWNRDRLGHSGGRSGPEITMKGGVSCPV